MTGPALDFGGNPIEESTPVRRVASFACLCGCQSEVQEPCPVEIPCWSKDCSMTMFRWFPPHEPPYASAERWDGEKLVIGR